MRTKVNSSLIQQCIKLYQEQASRSDVARVIQDRADLGKSQSFEWAKRIWDNNFDDSAEDELEINEPDSEVEVSALTFSDKYIFNKDDDKYIFLTESKLGKNIVLDSGKVKGIIKSYSNFKGEQSSINEVAIKFDIPRKFVIEILKCLEITHDSLPVTNEELSEKDEDLLVEEILQEKRFALHQKIEKKDWVETKRQAEKWREFETGKLNPIQDYLEKLEFKPLPRISPDYVKEFDDEDTMVVGVFDTQIGAYANEDVLYFGEGWSTEKAVKAVDEYAVRLIAKAKKRGINKVVIIFGGDIFHGLNGETAKGTELKCDTLGFEQFDASVIAISGFVQRFAENFQSVDNKIITGNHEGFWYYPFFKLIESIFQNSKHVNFDISKKEFMHFRVKNALFLIHHGAAADYKFKIPNDDKGRKELIQRVARIAEREGDYDGVNRIFFVKGDTHSFECKDYGQFTFYVFGTPVTGDEYANALALESTPTQNALVLGDKKDYETLHITF